jgi:hypothetical protein
MQSLEKKRLNDARSEEEDHADDNQHGDDRPYGVDDLAGPMMKEEIHTNE